MRLVAHTVKHGEGKSAEELQKIRRLYSLPRPLRELCCILFRDLDHMHQIGAEYATGEGYGSRALPVSLSRAVQWYLRAADKGHSESQYDLGWMYLLGEGVAADPAEGMRWLRKAAIAGYGEAMRLLADLYRQGSYGVPIDAQEADAWATRLAEHLQAHSDDRRSREWDSHGDHV